jgi:hypothetical protein
MHISNGEPFISLETAANCFDEFALLSDKNKYIEHIANELDLYTYVFDICKVSASDGAGTTLTRKISGMCKVGFDYGGEWQDKIKVRLELCHFSSVQNQNLIGYSITPIDHHITLHNYLACSKIYLPDFIIYAKEVGIDLNVAFVEAIISDDSTFRELKRLSKIAPDGNFNLKQAANKYLKYCDGILEETIIAACELASARYDTVNQQTNPPEEIAREKLNDISEFFSDTKVTNETIEQFKKTLPDVWQEALFSKPSRVIEDLKNNNIDSNFLSTREKDNLYKTIGLLSLAIAKKNPNRFGDINNINANQIYKTLLEFLPLEPIGLGDKTVRTKVKQGVELLRDS